MFAKSILQRRSRRGAIILNPYGGGTLIGSIGSTTFQRGRFGNLARSRVKPVDPNTLRQQTVKSIMTQVSAEWDALAAAAVAEWDSYALNTPVTGPKGTEIVLTGRQMYMKSRMFQLRNGLGPLTTAPSTPGILAQPLLVMGYETTTGAVTIESASGMPTNGAVRVLTSRNLKATRNYWKGPFEQTAVEVTALSPPLTVATISPLPVDGEKVFVKYKAWDSDSNKVSSSVIAEVVATTA